MLVIHRHDAFASDKSIYLERACRMIAAISHDVGLPFHIQPHCILPKKHGCSPAHHKKWNDHSTGKAHANVPKNQAVLHRQCKPSWAASHVKSSCEELVPGSAHAQQLVSGQSMPCCMDRQIKERLQMTKTRCADLTITSSITGSRARATVRIPHARSMLLMVRCSLHGWIVLCRTPVRAALQSRI